MDATLLAFLVGTENRLVEAVKSALYGVAQFKALDASWQALIIQVIAGLIGVVLAVAFSLNILTSITGVPALAGEVVSGLALSFGSAGIQRLIDLAAAWTASKQAQAVYTKAQAAPSSMATKPVA